MTDAERRRKREDDALCEALLQVLWRIRAHVHGESPIGAKRLHTDGQVMEEAA